MRSSRSAYRMFQRIFSGSHATLATRHLVRADLVEALQHAGCALCHLAQQKSQRYVESLLDTAVIDVGQRDTWRHAKGFCSWHARMATALPQSSSSLAILYEDVLQHEMGQLAPLITSAPSSRWWHLRHSRRLVQGVQHWLRIWQQRGACQACRLWQEQEQLCLTVLLDDWLTPDLTQAFTQSSGLCLPHTARLLAYGAGHVHLPAVLVAQRGRMQALHDELREFIRKQDYRFAHESYGSEADAWQRVVALVVGTQDGSGPAVPSRPDRT